VEESPVDVAIVGMRRQRCDLVGDFCLGVRGSGRVTRGIRDVGTRVDDAAYAGCEVELPLSVPLSAVVGSATADVANAGP